MASTRQCIGDTDSAPEKGHDNKYTLCAESLTSYTSYVSNSAAGCQLRATYTLALLELHLLLQCSTERIEWVVSWNDLKYSLVTRSQSMINGHTFSSENIPIHLRPAIICSFCSLSLNDDLEEMAQIRSFSLDDEEPRTLAVASFHEIGSFRKLCSSSLRNPISTKTLMNSGKPAYLKVPLKLQCQHYALSWK